MITLIFGLPRVGKTALLTKFALDSMQPRNAIQQINKSKKTIDRLNKGGYSFSLPTDHLTFSDYPITADLRYRRVSHELDGFRFGMPNDIHKTLFVPPCSTILFDEGQRYYNSREHSKMSDFVSRVYEWHGHIELKIYLASQRPGLMDLNIRELASQVIEVVKLEHKMDGNKIVRSTWTCNLFDNSAKALNYIDSGKDSKLGERVKYTFEGNIFHHYNSHNFAHAFFKDKENKQFDLVRAMPYPLTMQGVEDFNDTHPLDIPSTFYKGGKR